MLSKATASQDFANVAPLIAENALYRFTDGDFSGIEAIRAAFEQTWASFPEDEWELLNVRVVHLDEDSAVVTYDTRWTATVNGERRISVGRGTNVIARTDGALNVILEHLSH
jgi:ketosteroid isomerase-like protein